MMCYILEIILNESIKGEDRISRQYSEYGSFGVTRDNQTGQEKHILYIGGKPSRITYTKRFKR